MPEDRPELPPTRAEVDALKRTLAEQAEEIKALKSKPAPPPPPPEPEPEEIEEEEDGLFDL